MFRAKTIAYLFPIVVLMFVPYFMGVGMQPAKDDTATQKTADRIFAVIQANRMDYSSTVIDDLSSDEQLISLDEHWVHNKALPLRAQISQVDLTHHANNAADINYSLQSLWAINQDNFPQSNKEREGLIYVLNHPGENYYTTVESKGVKYFMAVYPDHAISPACVQCHNHNNNSPKQDFAVGDLMGGVVVRIPLS
jgi:hypothetical protein